MKIHRNVIDIENENGEIRHTIVVERNKKGKLVERLRKMADEVEQGLKEGEGWRYSQLDLRVDLRKFLKDGDFLCFICNKILHYDEEHYHEIDGEKVRIN